LIIEIGPIQPWIESYFTGDKIFGVFAAVNEHLVCEHARQAGLLANCVSAVVAVIGPETGERQRSQLNSHKARRM
jgi:hypothetical protein